MNSHHGGRPVVISITVQPTLHMSACRPWRICLITSGAIQSGVPYRQSKNSSHHTLMRCAASAP